MKARSTLSFLEAASFDLFLHGFLRLFSPLFPPPFGALTSDLTHTGLLWGLEARVQRDPGWLNTGNPPGIIPDGSKAPLWPSMAVSWR